MELKGKLGSRNEMWSEAALDRGLEAPAHPGSLPGGGLCSEPGGQIGCESKITHSLSNLGRLLYISGPRSSHLCDGDNDSCPLRVVRITRAQRRAWESYLVTWQEENTLSIVISTVVHIPLVGH